MKILKHGDPKYIDQPDYKLECDYCGCIFTFDAADFLYVDKRVGGYAQVKCPDCRRILTVIPADCLNEEEDEND